MLRQNRGIEGLIGGPKPCKIRKRGCSYSSSSSSVVQNYRFKRAIFVGKRGGVSSSTLIPTWKMNTSSVRRIAVSPKKNPHSETFCLSTKWKKPPLSARKLAATLWEMNEIPSPRIKQNFEEKEMRGRGRDRIARSVQSGSLPPHLSDPSHSSVSERMDRSGTGSIPRRTSQRILRLTDPNDGGFDSLSSATSLMEIEMHSRGQTPKGGSLKELLKILNRIWGLEKQHSSSVSLISAIQAELLRAHVLIDQLIREKQQQQQSEKYKIDYLMKRFSEEKALWKSNEKERIRAAVETILGDLEVERKLRRLSESLNKKLGIELAENKVVLSKTVKELESEKRARQIMEQVCEELARGVGEDKAEVEELKRESAKVRKEMEKEREMLQLADVLREERLQMKLSDAKYQFEEKSAAVDKLRNELEAFLRAERVIKENLDGSPNCGSQREVGGHLSKTLVLVDHNEVKGEDEGEVEDGEKHDKVDPEQDLAESDLHSIELNMETTTTTTWQHTAKAAQVDPKRVSIEEEIKGRKYTSDDIPRGSISIERRISDGIDWDFGIENFPNMGDDEDERRKFSEVEKKNQEQDYGDETQRYKSVKGLRDHILSGSRMASARGFASTTRQWGQPWPSRDHDIAAALERPTRVQESFPKKERVVEARGGRNSKHSL